MNKKIVIVIPARYNSTRLPGKPLMDICGHSMLWWVYDRCRKINSVSSVIVATDDDRVIQECNTNKIPALLTPQDIATPNDRAYEVSKSIDAEYYIVVNGDEPLIPSSIVESVIPTEMETQSEMFCAYAISQIKDTAEVIDFSNTKVVFNKDNEALWISRSPIPYPKGRLDFPYYKMLGIACFSKAALQFYGKTERSMLEQIEEIDPYRFLENGIKVHVRLCKSDSISVDTYKDLEKVRTIFKEKYNL